MTRNPIGEIDLLAYADGQLRGDSARTAEVERYLAANPEEAARLRDFAAQNEALRRHYGRVVEEPVPERLTGVLDAPPRRWFGDGFGRAAAVLALMVSTGLAGWMIGRDPPLAVQPDFLTEALESHGYARDLSPVAQGQKGALLALDLVGSDFAAAGFSLVDRRLVSFDGVQAVHMVYADPSGRRLSVFAKIRPASRRPTVELREYDGGSVAHWVSGPFSFALVAEGDSGAIRGLAEAVADGGIRWGTTQPTPAPSPSPAPLEVVPQVPGLQPSPMVAGGPPS